MITCRPHGFLSRSFVRGMLALSIFFSAAPVNAHDGPPFPIIVDQKAGPAVISLWGDPDVGTGTFFVIVNAAEITGDLKVQVAVQPVSGRLAEVFYPAEREEVRGQIQYKALVAFDAEELWQVRVHVQRGEEKGEATASVEVTPPGLGRWDLLIYLLPFLAIGFLWIVAILRKRSRTSHA